ncbi:MAG: HlyC/CorC family transporter [Betaproteobacteria bacterium]|nr:HlyC/CorC family transporter [Betaproteobacteria bacterium]
MSLSDTALVLALLIVLNAFLALSELSIASAKRIKLTQLRDAGNKGAAVALHLKDNPNSFLGVVQIGLNVVGILAGVFGEAALNARFAVLLGQAGVSEGWLRETLSLTLAVGVITAFFLLLGDLLPKRIAIHAPEKLACALAPLVLALQKPFAPLLWFFGKLVDAILTFFNIRNTGEEAVTAGDIHAIVEAGARAGAVDRDERHLIRNVLSLTERAITSAMTPRASIVSIDIGDDEETIKTVLAEAPKARFVVTHGDIDHPVGYIDAADLLARLIHNQSLRLQREELKAWGMKDLLMMPDTITVLDVLDRFRNVGEDIALVANEYGVVVGLITLNDVMAAIMGRIAEEVAGEKSIVRMTDRENAWLIDGMAAIADVKELFGWARLPGEENYETISGFLMSLIKKWPRKADVIAYQGVKFVIVDTEGSRIDQVLATLEGHPGVERPHP